MSKIESTLFQILKSKKLLLYILLIIPALAFFGWLSGNMLLASYSSSYIPIAPSSIVLTGILITLTLLSVKFEKVRFFQIASTALILFIVLLCINILIQYFFGFSIDVEKVLLKNPQKSGNIVIGRMSPISSILYIFVCLGMIGSRQKNIRIFGYTGGIFTLISFFVSSVLLIGYLYKALPFVWRKYNSGFITISHFFLIIQRSPSQRI